MEEVKLKVHSSPLLYSKFKSSVNYMLETKLVEWEQGEVWTNVSRNRLPRTNEYYLTSLSGSGRKVSVV